MTALDEAKLAATADMVGHTGAANFQIRHQDDEAPTVWMAVAVYPDGRWDAGAGCNPTHACERLLDQIIDGAVCTHCQRMTVVEHDFDNEPLLGDLACHYQFDPELSRYRRSCEGEAP